MSGFPIADYALLSDCHSAALVSRAGSVDWLCFPRFDSPAVFARLLDERAGHWSIAPVEESTSSRRYLEGSLVLETRLETAGGVAVLTDCLAVGPNEQGHELGAAPAVPGLFHRSTPGPGLASTQEAQGSRWSHETGIPSRVGRPSPGSCKRSRCS